jgi:tetratricopeptide (TPR) repeat protein
MGAREPERAAARLQARPPTAETSGMEAEPRAGGSGADAPRAGRLEETALPRLLLSLAAAGYTGELSLTAGRERARIAWLRGHPVSCDGEPSGPGLIDLLEQRGGLGEADAARARATCASKRCAEEAALLALGVVGARDLVLARRALVERRLVALGRLRAGDYSVAPDGAPPAAGEPFRVDPLPLVQRLLAAHFRPDQLLADLEAKLTRYPEPSAAFEALRCRLEPGPALEDLVQRLDGAQNAWTLIATTGDADRIAALWLLDVAGGLAWRDAPAVAETTAKGDEPAPPPVSSEPEIEIEVVGRPTPGGRGPGGAPTEVKAAADDARSAALRTEIAEKRSRLGELDHYGLLGVERNASPAILKRAYLTAAKRFHPDALSRLGLEDLKRDANEIFAAITRAHEVLSDPARRRDYDAGLDGHVQVDADRVAQAEGLYRRAEMMMRAGQFAGALELAEGAVRLWPEDSAYQGALGWCLYKKNPPDEARAREHLEKALALDPRDAVVHLRLGIVLKALGDAAGAARASARGKQLDPTARA